MQSANEIVEAIQNLPRGEQDKVRRLLREEERAKSHKLKADLELYKKATGWIEENRKEFLNQWVCLEGDRLISHGSDGIEVHRQAKAAGIEAPFVVRVIEEPENFIGAWL